jgi:hypothetical protein
MVETIEMSEPQEVPDSGETPETIDDNLVPENESRAHDGEWIRDIVVFAAVASLFFFGTLVLTQGWRGQYHLSVSVGTAALALSAAVVLRRSGFPKIQHPQSNGDLLKGALFALAFGGSLDYFVVRFYPNATLAWWDVLTGIFFASASGLAIVSVEGGFEFAIGGILGLALPAAVQRWGPPSFVEVPLEILIPGALLLLGRFLLKKGPSEILDLGLLGLLWGWLILKDPALENRENFPFGPAFAALAVLAVLRIFFGLLKIPQTSKAKYVICITMITVGIVTGIYRK